MKYKAPDPTEMIEWIVGYIELASLRTPGPSKFIRHSEGAQSIFGKTRAKKIAKLLGAPFAVFHLDKLKDFQ